MKVLLVLLLSLWLAECKVPISTEKECEWGPSYWCQTLDTATRCNKVDHCQSLWKTQPLKQGLCEACDLVLTLVKPFINNNGTETEAKDAVEKACNILTPIESECKEFLDSYFPVVWKLLESEFDNDQICVQIGLCNRTSVTKKQGALVSEAPPVKQGLCEICELVVSFLKNYVDSNTTEQEVKAAIEQLCTILPYSLDGECEKLVENNFDVIWALVKSEFDNDLICKQLGLCNRTKISTKIKATLSKAPPVKQGLCQICELVVSFLKPYVDSNSTEQEVKAAIEQLCTILPSTLGSECSSLVKDNFGIIWELVKSEFDNDQICNQFQLCNSTKIATKPKATLSKAQDNCVTCKLVVSYLKLLVDNGAIETDAENAVTMLCKKLPGSFLQSECPVLVKAFFPKIWAMLKEEIDSDAICSQLNLCSTEARTVEYKMASPKVKLGSATCDICELVVKFIGHFVDNNSTEEEAKGAVEKVCTLLPSSTSSICTTLIDTYFPTIWQLLMNEVDSGEICSQINLCNKTSVTVKSGALPKVNSAITCDICQLVVKFITPYVDSNSTESDVQQAVNEVCNILPSSVKSECSELISTYFPMIWKMLVEEEVDSGKVCDQLKLCSSSAKLLTKRPVQVQDDACDMCKMVANTLKPYVDNNAIEAEAKSDLIFACNILPEELESKCNDFVKDNFDQIWKAVQKGIDSGTICKQLGLCTSTTSVMTKTPVKVQDELCDLCKLAANFLKPYVDSNTTEAKAKSDLMSVCNLLPNELKSRCNDFVKDNFDQIWAEVQKDIDSGTICKQLGLCNSTTSVMTKTPVKGIVLCTVCELVLSELDKLLQTNKTESAVMDALEKVCGIIPSGYRKECDDVISKYGPTIYKLILDGVSSKLICGMIGICTGEKKTYGLSISCDECQEGLTMVKDLLPLESKYLVEGMEYLCQFMPDAIRDECVSLVDTYGSELVNELVNDIDPQQICKDVGFCSSSAAQLQGAKRMTCRSCHHDIKSVGQIVGNNQPYFLRMMDSVCKRIPEQKTCSSIVSTHGDVVYRKLSSTLLDSRKACKGACDARRSRKAHPRLAYNAEAFMDTKNFH